MNNANNLQISDLLHPKKICLGSIEKSCIFIHLGLLRRENNVCFVGFFLVWQFARQMKMAGCMVRSTARLD